ncbi:VOC family protein [Gloeobacter kilaueensis]|uniref:Glyoxalase/bleomycin resistance protein/dioxygenase n=1 Tax=Gloeobacter kilaueensis (strain ATCC BAA-2537 / CCAP 1431/1 / ULC 316 / JS1) TaxID=1183438 RepID=U5QNR0_GLOK1|nr:VOC family protein [Gloeobacter kilaueensis]AGY59234.1 glyoxalase/bleomycin resistance protein/dioxygenase [Gloeobacter kilaueensis JS1]
MHHVSIRTADIFRSIAFYGLLGFEVEERFTTGMTLACWLAGALGRIELIQIPEPKPAPDAWLDEHYTGYYHTSFLVDDVAATVERLAAAGVPVLLEPRPQQIGERTYMVAFIVDPDGLPIELLAAA